MSKRAFTFLTDCVNCGSETMVYRLEDNCQFCGKNVSKKEVTMSVENQSGAEEREPVPTRPKKRKHLRKYFEKNKEAILADYTSMKLKDFFKRWGISTNMWIELKKDWSVQGKHNLHATRKKSESPPEDPPDDGSLTEHERYLILVGWQQAAREFMKAWKEG